MPILHLSTDCRNQFTWKPCGKFNPLGFILLLFLVTTTYINPSNHLLFSAFSPLEYFRLPASDLSWSYSFVHCLPDLISIFYFETTLIIVKQFSHFLSSSSLMALIETETLLMKPFSYLSGKIYIQEGGVHKSLCGFMAYLQEFSKIVVCFSVAFRSHEVRVPQMCSHSLEAYQ